MGTINSVASLYQMLKKMYPNDIALLRGREELKAYNEDAELLEEILNITPRKIQLGGILKKVVVFRKEDSREYINIIRQHGHMVRIADHI